MCYHFPHFAVSNAVTYNLNLEIMKRLLKDAILIVLSIGALASCGGNNQTYEAGSTPANHSLSRQTKEEASNYEEMVQELYIAYFGRPADPAGLVNFENALLNAQVASAVALVQSYNTNIAVKNLIDSFGTSPESVALYGNGNTASFVTAIFQNVLGRAPASDGLAYWTNAIDSGAVTRGCAALSILIGAMENHTTQGGLDQQTLGNRLGVAENFTIALVNQNADGAYVGPNAAATARAMLSGVTSSSSDYGPSYFPNVNATVAGMIAQYDASLPSQSVPGLSLFAGNVGILGQGIGVGPLAVDRYGNIYLLEGTFITKFSPAGVASNFAGLPGIGGAIDGVGSAARFGQLSGIAVDVAGNVYVADNGNKTVRRISLNGTVTTIAGTAGTPGTSDGTGAAALFNSPQGIAVDASGNIYVGDGSIRKITPTGVVSTMTLSYVPSANNNSPWTGFGSPQSIALDANGNIYVADSYNQSVFKISTAGVLTPFFGAYANPPRTNAYNPTDSYVQSVAIDIAGNIVVGDDYNVKKLSPSGAVLFERGFDGITGSAELFSGQNYVAVDASGNIIVADTGNNAIQMISSTGTVSTLLAESGVSGSSDGIGPAARFYAPEGIASDSKGNIFIADSLNYAVRKISPSGAVTTLAGRTGTSVNGVASVGVFGLLSGLATDSAGNVYVADRSNGIIQKISSDGTTTTLAGSPLQYGYADGTGKSAIFGVIQGIATDSAGNIYVADTSNCAVRKISPTGVVTTIAGIAGGNGSTDGPGSRALFCGPTVNFNGLLSLQGGPTGIAVDAAGNVYVSDNGNNNIRKIDTSGMVTTLAGHTGVVGFVDGVGTQASFNNPQGLAVDRSGNVYVADANNGTIRKITPSGTVTTVAGVALEVLENVINPKSYYGIVLGDLPGRFPSPQYLAIGADGALYLTTENAVLRIQLP